MSVVRSAEFVISAVAPAQFPRTQLPEVAFVGRSNVGKSSLLNALVNRKGLAKTSGTPGKTRQINFFRINDRYHYVDLPGYGYAKVSKDEREKWRTIIERYLTGRDQLRLVAALVDIRHEPTALDREMIAWLEAIGRPYVVVLTKADKISEALAAERVEQLRSLPEVGAGLRDVFTFSTKTRATRDQLFTMLESALRARIS